MIGRSGWNAFSDIITPGDYNSDGATDLLARKPDGTLWLYAGTGLASSRNEGYRPGVLIGRSGWSNFNTVLGTPDVNGDTKNDLLASNSSGNLWLYQGTGMTGERYMAARKTGTL